MNYITHNALWFRDLQSDVPPQVQCLYLSVSQLAFQRAEIRNIKDTRTQTGCATLERLLEKYEGKVINSCPPFSWTQDTCFFFSHALFQEARMLLRVHVSSLARFRF